MLWKSFAGNVRRRRIAFSRPGVEVLEDRTLLSFITAPTYAAGLNPNSVAVGDFNGDDIPDLAVANLGTYPDYQGTVSVLLGMGDGTFQAAQDYAVGSGALSLAVGDFNLDGKLDLVAVGGSGVSILLGNGDGSLQAAQSYDSGSYLISVAVADFNGDGSPDLAVANANSTTVSVLLGNGDGTFQAAQSYAAGDEPISLAVGDFNGDGRPDLAVANGFSNGTVSVLLGNDDGSFQPPQSYAAGSGSQPKSAAVGDFNGDGRLDLVVANYFDTVSVLLGNGDGSFQTAQSFAVGPNPVVGLTPLSVAVGDFNGDAHLDVAVARVSVVSILPGNGDGTFQTAHHFAAGPTAASVAVGDFNRDGTPDLAAVNRDSDTVSILLGKGDGTFYAAQSYDPGGSGAAVADFSGAGIADVAIANSGTVFLGNGDGTFQPFQGYAAGSGPRSVAVGDFNGDGKQDIVTTNYAYVIDPRMGTITIIESDVRVYLGNGDGTFQAGQVSAAGTGPLAVAVGDFNGDGIPDLIVANGSSNTVSVLLGNGDGTFQPAQDYGVDSDPESVAVADFNGDGNLDIVVANQSAGTVSVLLGKGDGTFRDAANYFVGVGPLSVAVGDFNGDGIPDLVVANRGTFPNYTDGSVSVLLGDGDGTFQPAQSYAAGNGPFSVAVADFNGDGHLDLAVANAVSGTVTILLGNGDGTFQAPQTYVAGPGGSLAVGDFTGDGFPDLALAGAVTTILLNAADWGGGHAATPPRGLGLHPTAHSPPRMETVSTLLAASQAQMQHSVPLTYTDLEPSPLRQWPVQTEIGQPANSETTFIPKPIGSSRHAQDAIFAGWSDEVLDVLARA